MATLIPAARHSNIERSLQAYIATNVATALSVQVVYPRAQRLGTLPARWVEVEYVPLSPVTDLMYAPGGFAIMTQYLVNLNLFELDDRRRDGSGDATVYSLTALQDGVYSAFYPGSAIPVYDYGAVGNPRVGGMTVQETTITPIGTVSVREAEVTQVNVSPKLLYYQQAA